MSQETSHEVQEETENIPTPLLLGISLGLVVFLLLTIIASLYGVRGMATSEKIRKENMVFPVKVDALKEKQQEILNSTGTTADGVAYVSIDVAMKRVIAESAKQVAEKKPEEKELNSPEKKVVKPSTHKIMPKETKKAHH